MPINAWTAWANALLIAAGTFFPSKAFSADARFTEEEVKAAFLLNFGRFVEWPAGTLDKKPDRFTVCLVGQGEVTRKFEVVLQNQKIKSRSIELHKLPLGASLANCQIAYFANTANSTLSEALMTARASPTLTVGDSADFAQRGGMIQFKLESNHLRFRINLVQAEDAGLKISSKLLGIAEVIR